MSVSEEEVKRLYLEQIDKRECSHEGCSERLYEVGDRYECPVHLAQ